MKQKILSQIDTLIDKDGLHSTFIKDIKLYKSSTSKPREPLIYDDCLILVLSGKKVAYIQEHKFTYDFKNYLVVPTTLPFECETIASKKEPFICLLITIDKNIILELIDSFSSNKLEKADKLAVFADATTSEIEDITLRLLKALESQEESAILGKQILREFFYRVLLGENAKFIHKMFTSTSNEAKILQAIKTIHHQYSEHIAIPDLAKDADMSVSSFHTHFKKITSYSPLQYIKNIRLNRAKDFITKHSYQVNKTAYAVGYESTSQFSKDFKTYFGYSAQDAKASYVEYKMATS